MTSTDEPILVPSSLHERLLTTVAGRLPRKSFGYLLSASAAAAPTDFVLFQDNIRNTDGWRDKFESYGRYFVIHHDAGFVATPEESWRLQKEIWARGMTQVGVFHSHLRHPANFSQIDYDLHVERFENLWHMIISMRNPDLPQVRVYAASRAGVRELPVVLVADGAHDPPAVTATASRDDAIARAREVLRVDACGRPLHHDNRAIFLAIEGLLRTQDREAIHELLLAGFLRDSGNRYQEHAASRMRVLDSATFEMGTKREGARHFCGETPAHLVQLSPFAITETQVTNEEFARFDRRRLDVGKNELRQPAVDVTWFDAAVFAMWMGCRMPTEAEWEYACGSGEIGEWCCEEEALLPRYAWYSENSGGRLHEVKTREPNPLDLYDLHGNVWEWCQDGYDRDFYSGSPSIDPLKIGDAAVDKVCRGGSMHSLSEMCRTRFRFHEPPGFRARDLGFRLAEGEASPLFSET